MSKLKAEKLSEALEVRDNKLVHVERWNVPVPNETLDGEVLALREYVKPCGERVRFDGRLISSSIVKHYITTGEWVYRVPKPKKAPAKPFRAVVSHQGKTKHIGCFATVEERDAAVFAWKLGLHKNT